jgi:hypothetical protein
MPLIVQSHITNLTPGMERSTLASAGRSAETNGDRMARGLPGRCVRGRFKHLIRPESCAAEFLFNEPDCVRDGGCTTGRIMADRYKGEVMARNLGFCTDPDCPSKGEEVLIKCAGMCAPCYRMDLAARKGKKPAARVSTILDAEESAALDKAMERAQDVTCHDPAAEAAARASNPVEFPVTMATVREIVADAIDESRPFTLAGIEFEPMHERRRTGGNYLTVRAKNIGISVDAAEALGLNDYQFASYTVSKDGLAVAVKFSVEARPKALKISRKTGNIVISAQPLGTRYPGLVGKRGVLEFTGVRGWYVARFDGEVAA